MTKAISTETILNALNDFSEAVGFNGERKALLDDNVKEINIRREDWNRALMLFYDNRKGMSCRSMADWWNRFIDAGYIFVDEEDSQFFLEMDKIRADVLAVSEYYKKKS